MSGSVGGGETAEPNLTPILDMVFQLITFFMLVVNFKSASMDLSLKLPVVGSARPVDSQGQIDLLVMNVNLDGALVVYGNTVTNIEGYIRNEAELSRKILRRTKPDVQPGDDLPTMIVVRADRNTPFKHLNRVIETCIKQGFRSYSFKAMNREEES
jgi:biopolymer transport protein ExbD